MWPEESPGTSATRLLALLRQDRDHREPVSWWRLDAKWSRLCRFPGLSTMERLSASIEPLRLPLPQSICSIALDLRSSDLLGQAREFNVFQYFDGACPRLRAQMSRWPKTSSNPWRSCCQSLGSTKQRRPSNESDLLHLFVLQSAMQKSQLPAIATTAVPVANSGGADFQSEHAHQTMPAAMSASTASGPRRLLHVCVVWLQECFTHCYLATLSRFPHRWRRRCRCHSFSRDVLDALLPSECLGVLRWRKGPTNQGQGSCELEQKYNLQTKAIIYNIWQKESQTSKSHKT